jgi:hypothetical protein
MTDSPHPSLPGWVDYARLGHQAGQGGPSSHLDGGCTTCRATADSLSAFADFVSADRRHEPPESLVAEAVALFRGSEPPVRVEAVELDVEVLYDSRLEGAQAGRRSARRPTQLLYQAGRFCLDVQLTREAPSNQVLAVGQIVDVLDKDHLVAGAPLTVASAQDTLVRSFTNEFGEFQVEYVPRGELWLKIVLDDGQAFVIPLPRLSEMETP